MLNLPRWWEHWYTHITSISPKRFLRGTGERSHRYLNHTGINSLIMERLLKKSFLLLAVSLPLVLLKRSGFVQVPIRLYKYEGCKDSLPFKQDNVSVTMNKQGVVVLKGSINVTEYIGNLTLMTIALDRCASPTDSQTCEYYTVIKTKDVCQHLETAVRFWPKGFQNVTPPFLCPIKKQVHVIKETQVDPKFATVMPNLFGYYWKATTKLFGKNKRMVSCFRIEVYIQKTKSKS